jgi:hypothetical protein
MPGIRHPKYFTIADRRFFPGAVAMLNSLRLTGNIGDLFVLDQGMTPEQRDSLEQHATVVRIPDRDFGHPVLAKAFPHALGAEGTIVLIDSDMIVTSPLSSIISLAERGKICVFPDHYAARDRWFAEWQEIFELPTPPRHQTYFNAGFVCFSTQHWPDFLGLYWEACQRIPSGTVHQGSSAGGDIGARAPGDSISLADQDALNALLMSVIPPEAIAELPAEGQATRGDLTRVRIIDEQGLECSLDGRPTTILHYTRNPKAWEHGNWWRVRWDAFTLLMPRVLLADDVPLRLQAASMPVWARRSNLSRACLRALDLGHRVAAPALRKVRRVLRSRRSQ